jgi:hypothetical protein
MSEVGMGREGKRNAYWVLVGKSGVMKQLKNLGKDGMIILQWILKKIRLEIPI